ncbi:hypothetical protein SDRG_03392 [Saprolegnia diclina VS20]|uniref:Protein arginine methyltransferase NDUFAF7 n=1 Tax=Saprolegnia diclina (strain VS20) TaxID=1156394 RepID=T0QWW8_SAPDV|nr:hypothetical protein SDRG_03392 [Saprolegnia diclina VS20]EQC39186.1 hypothetical protein SDRG_03392 [Saprolegnia diclina VS20]|eukprot:XP_008607247.1 hypothetical protein SDRG_03392 [Saprolegnia diclina VS20]
MLLLRRVVRRPVCARGFASQAPLTREYIHNCLYRKEEGYFTSTQREVLHAPKEPIDFNDLWGKREYKNQVAALYAQDKEAWMTPVEVFYPYYSRAIANYMMMSPHTLNAESLHIYEIGGGAGTNALCILDYLKEQAPKLYANTTYTMIEISARMAARQAARVAPHPNCKVINSDILTYSANHPNVNDPCFFIAMEVLDNLPHDKVTLADGEWFQTHVRDDAEELHPLRDPLIAETLEYFSCEIPLRGTFKRTSGLATQLRSMIGMREKLLNAAFVPTGAMQLLHTLQKSFPKHHLIAADFDELPAPSLDKSATHQPYDHPRSATSTASGPLHAANAPLVASKTDGVTVDHDTYLVPGGIADIFFPTDFIKLKQAYCRKMELKEHEVSIVKSGAFLKEFGEVDKTRTILGYNPLVDDYANTSFILS